jgi:hypothetical protein
MKVRHKQSRKDAFQYWDVIEESPNFYIVRNGLYKPGEEQRLVLFSKNDYEPVPTETWRDVTGEMKVTDTWPSKYGHSNAIADDDDYVLWIPATQHERVKQYRLRKVRLCDGSSAPCTEVYAFIVEKREEQP